MKKLTLSALSIALVSQFSVAAPDVIFTNGDIVTMTGSAERAQAVAVKDGKIVAVGDTQQLLSSKGDNTEIRDLAGNTMTPGFIDSHGHFAQYIPVINSPYVYPSPLGEGNSISDIQRIIKDHMSDPKLDPERLHFAIGYDDAAVEENRHPTRWELDEVTGEYKLCALHISGHFLTCNSKGLEAMGYNQESENPPGGVLRRDENGVLTGVLDESATYPMFQHIAVADMEEALTNVKLAQDMFLAYGITTAQEGKSNTQLTHTLKALADQGAFYMDVITYPMWSEFEGSIEVMPIGEYHNGVKVGGMKITTDGSPQGKTAYLSTPYWEPPHSHAYHYHGYPVLSQEEINQWVDLAYSHNAQVIAHTNGDAAADLFINAVEHAAEKHGEADRRPVAIHAQTIRLDQVKRMAKLDVIPSFFGAHTFFWGDWHKRSVLGPWRAANISPMGWANEYDLMFTTHMDAPVLFPDQLLNMWTSVNRVTRSGETLGEHHKIEPYQALEAITINAAYQNFEEDSKGSIEVGKRADLVILAENPLTVDPMDIKDIKILETIKDGNTVYVNQ
ncbi:amidohydrolase [Vibrio coralliirubri]|uniref:amidohydrolase n=1 Tax=Vibrio coralliirubri TaxID=1516159 RepID=UPI00073E8E61|nr:amidohydrolase [Vibrio coralliirubri]